MYLPTNHAHNEALAAQNGRCRICYARIEEGHLVRNSVICSRCKQGLDAFNNSPFVLESALHLLESYNETH